MSDLFHKISPRNLLIAAIAIGILGMALQQITQKLPFIRGNAAYYHSAFGDAEVFYRNALQQEVDSAKVHFNLGNALYKQERYKEAILFYKAAIQKETDSAHQTAYWFNMGNALFMAGDTLQSIAAFKEALLLEQHNVSIRRNLLYVLHKLEAARAKKEVQKAKDKQAKEPEKLSDQSAPEHADTETQDQNSEAQEYAVSEKEMENLLDLLNQSEENVRGKIAKSRQKPKAIASDEPDY